MQVAKGCPRSEVATGNYITVVFFILFWGAITFWWNEDIEHTSLSFHLVFHVAAATLNLSDTGCLLEKTLPYAQRPHSRHENYFYPLCLPEDSITRSRNPKVSWAQLKVCVSPVEWPLRPLELTNNTCWSQVVVGDTRKLSGGREKIELGQPKDMTKWAAEIGAGEWGDQRSTCRMWEVHRHGMG